MCDEAKSFDWITPTIGLVGVALGALLGLITPIVSNRLERAKERNRIKPELIKALYTLYDYRKVSSSLLNNNAVWVRSANFIYNDLRNLTLETVQREELLRQERLINEAIIKNVDASNVYIIKVTEIEAEVRSLVIKVLEYYGEKTYNKLDSLVKPSLSKLRNDVILHKYNSLDREQLESVTNSLSEQLISQAKQFTIDCDYIVTQVSRTL